MKYSSIEVHFIHSTMHPPPRPPPGFTKKQPLDIALLQNQPYYKIRALLNDVRPHFLEDVKPKVIFAQLKVLRTPDFQKSKAASEIRQKLKVLLDLYKEMVPETMNAEKHKSVPETMNAEKLKSTSNLHNYKVSGDVPEKLQTPDVKIEGTYIVGGSAFGWNFITYPAIGTTYYGRTKESVRALRHKS